MNQIFLETRMFMLSDGEEIMTLAFFVLIQYRSVTDRRTDRRTSLLWLYQRLHKRAGKNRCNSNASVFFPECRLHSSSFLHGVDASDARLVSTSY